LILGPLDSFLALALGIGFLYGMMQGPWSSWASLVGLSVAVFLSPILQPFFYGMLDVVSAPSVMKLLYFPFLYLFFVSLFSFFGSWLDNRFAPKSKIKKVVAGGFSGMILAVGFNLCLLFCLVPYLQQIKPDWIQKNRSLTWAAEFMGYRPWLTRVVHKYSGFTKAKTMFDKVLEGGKGLAGGSGISLGQVEQMKGMDQAQLREFLNGFLNQAQGGTGSSIPGSIEVNPSGAPTQGSQGQSSPVLQGTAVQGFDLQKIQGLLKESGWKGEGIEDLQAGGLSDEILKNFQAILKERLEQLGHHKDALEFDQSRALRER